MLIEVTRHGCTIYPKTYNETRSLYGYVKRELLEEETVYNKRTNTKEVKQKAVYAAATSDHKEFRLLKSDLKPFLQFLEFDGIDPATIEVKDVSVDTWASSNIPLKEGFTPRNAEQAEAVAFGLKVEEPTRTLEAATGFGKTFCGIYMAAQLGRRTAFIMEPGHIKTWLADLDDFTGFDPEKVVVIQGGEGIETAINLAKDDAFLYDYVFVSATTMRNYIKDYENKDEYFPYGCPPQDFLKLLGIGFLVRDEAHESIHALCKQTMYSNVPNILYLSATLVSDNPFINRIYEKIYPAKDRWQSKPNQHIAVRSLFYGSKFSANLKTNGPRGYSHVLYEKSILKSARLKKGYWDIISDVLDTFYLASFKEGKKALVVSATINMCNFLAKEAAKRYPDRTIGIYAGGAKKAELYERDIVFSTPKGAGTGVNIPNLALGVNTVAISSTQLSRQIMGRTRPIKLYPEDDPFYVMVWNQNVKQHLQYEKRRAMDCRGRCKDYYVVNMPHVLSK